MRIHFLGAAETVTGSQYLIEVNGQRLLLECGFFQGKRQDTNDRNRSFAYDPRTLQAAILSHAHIDHSGNLPNLVKHGYRGPIYTTPGTASLADVMVRDSGHIQEADVAYLNKHRQRDGLPPLEPIYTLADAAQVAQLFRPVPYNQPFTPVTGVTARLVDAGHILGSAAIVLDVEEPGRKKFRFWFSGDIGREQMPLLRDPVLPGADVDYLMMECTYGDQPHANPQVAFDQFREVVARTVKRTGKVIVPAFAVGRTQELVYSLHRMNHAGEIPLVPVFVDSPLAVTASEIFQQHPEYFDEETQTFIAHGTHPALSYAQLTYVRTVDESKAINGRPGPLVIISASGMAETGRILHHLRNNIEDPRNTIVLVSWQAPNTLGRRLQEQERRVKIFGEEFYRQAEVVAIDGLSAHAGQDALIRYAKSASSARQIILVHSEPPAATAFRQKLSAAGAPPSAYPKQGDVIEL